MSKKVAQVQIHDHTSEYLGAVDKALEAALEEIGILVEGDAIELITSRQYPHKDGTEHARVDTGLLRNSITYAIDGEAAKKKQYSGKEGKSGSYSGTAPEEQTGRSVIVGTNVEYAVYVHEGTSRMEPNRFLKDAVEMNRGQIKQIIDGKMG